MFWADKGTTFLGYYFYSNLILGGGIKTKWKKGKLKGFKVNQYHWAGLECDVGSNADEGLASNSSSDSGNSEAGSDGETSGYSSHSGKSNFQSNPFLVRDRKLRNKIETNLPRWRQYRQFDPDNSTGGKDSNGSGSDSNHTEDCFTYTYSHI